MSSSRAQASLFLVPPAAVVVDTANRRIGLGRDLDQVERPLDRVLARVREWQHADLRSVFGDHPHVVCGDLFVHACRHLGARWHGRLALGFSDCSPFTL
jgi:hypothetical protein